MRHRADAIDFVAAVCSLDALLRCSVTHATRVFRFSRSAGVRASRGDPLARRPTRVCRGSSRVRRHSCAVGWGACVADLRRTVACSQRAAARIPYQKGALYAKQSPIEGPGRCDEPGCQYGGVCCNACRRSRQYLRRHPCHPVARRRRVVVGQMALAKSMRVTLSLRWRNEAATPPTASTPPRSAAMAPGS